MNWNTPVHIRATSSVNATAADLWKVLENPVWDWSEFVTGLWRGDGERATLRLRGIPIPIPVRVLHVDPEREIRWRGGIPLIFEGEHYFRLETNGDTTTVEHGEVFSGVLGSIVIGLVETFVSNMYARDIQALAKAAS